MTTRVMLYGFLGKKFGKVWNLDVKTPAEAIRALRANLGDGFYQELAKNNNQFHVLVGKTDINKDELILPSGKSVVKIIPAIAGSKRAGALQTIFGVILVIIGGLVSVFGNAALGAAIVKAGYIMIIGGVAQMLFAPPKPNKNGPNERPENAPSYAFDGPVNVTAQGQPIAIGYGRLRVGSAVISGGIYSDQVNSVAQVVNPVLSSGPAPLRSGAPIVGQNIP